MRQKNQNTTRKLKIHEKHDHFPKSHLFDIMEGFLKQKHHAIHFSKAHLPQNNLQK